MTIAHVGRREFIASLAAAGAAALVPDVSRGAQGGPATRPAPHRIDVHYHFSSPGFIAAIKARNTGQVPLMNWAPAKALEDMDRDGVATSIVSTSEPNVWFGEDAPARALARECNEFGARLMADHPGRFGMFATLPLPDVDGALREIEYAFDTLKADGVGLLSSYGNQWLGDAAFLPVFQELERRRAVVYVHPTDAACCPNMVRGVAAQMLEYPTDTTRTIVSLIVGGTASKTPNVRYVFSHAGGTLMAVAGRFLGAQADAAALAKPAEPDSRLYHLRRFYYDTAGAANTVNMQAMKTLVSTSQIVFGTDAPFFDGAPIIAGLRNSGFTPEEIRAIERDNSLKMLPRFG